MQQKDILFVLPYPLFLAPSQRFRVEAYFDLLDQRGITYDTDSFLDEGAWQILYKKGSLLQKAGAVLKGFLKRLGTVSRSRQYKYVFIHREASPIGPPLFEWMMAKVLGKKIIYDFDDAIWIPNVSEGNRLAGLVKCYWKVRYICRWAFKVSAGNDFLAGYAGQFNPRVVYNPTCVDTENKYSLQVNQTNRKPVTIGWTGSHSTLQFFAVLYPVLKKLEQLHHFRLLVICNQKPAEDLASMEFIPWRKETEIEDLAQIDIGIMPLKEDAWSEGKCGFKIIQYMALGIPAVASPAGVNKKIIDQGKNGYICSTEEEWIASLTELLNNEQKRVAFGVHGRDKIRRAYSITSNAANFVTLFSNE